MSVIPYENESCSFFSITRTWKNCFWLNFQARVVLRGILTTNLRLCTFMMSELVFPKTNKHSSHNTNYPGFYIIFVKSLKLYHYWPQWNYPWFRWREIASNFFHAVGKIKIKTHKYYFYGRLRVTCGCFLKCPESLCKNGYSFNPFIILACIVLHILNSSLIITHFDNACVHFKYMLTFIFSRHTLSMMKTLAIARDSLSLQLCFYFMWVNCKMKALIFETKAALKSVVL